MDQPLRNLSLGLSDEEIEKRKEARKVHDARLRRVAAKLGVSPITDSYGWIAWGTMDGEKYDFLELMDALLDRLNSGV